MGCVEADICRLGVAEGVCGAFDQLVRGGGRHLVRAAATRALEHDQAAMAPYGIPFVVNPDVHPEARLVAAEVEAGRKSA